MDETLATETDHAGFVRANTQIISPPLVPEIRLHLATEVVPLWQMSEDALEETGLPPPFWAFAWAGGLALARYVLDHPETVRDAHVLDFASGSGLVAIAAALTGASQVTAADIDPFAVAAIALNAQANSVEVTTTGDDLVSRPLPGIDTVLAADICYERPLAERVTDWLGDLSRSGVNVLIGDPGRTYLPRDRLERIAAYEVETTRELEDCALRRTGVWRFRA